MSAQKEKNLPLYVQASTINGTRIITYVDIEGITHSFRFSAAEETKGRNDWDPKAVEALRFLWMQKDEAGRDRMATQVIGDCMAFGKSACIAKARRESFPRRRDPVEEKTKKTTTIITAVTADREQSKRNDRIVPTLADLLGQAPKVETSSSGCVFQLCDMAAGRVLRRCDKIVVTDAMLGMAKLDVQGYCLLHTFRMGDMLDKRTIASVLDQTGQQILGHVSMKIEQDPAYLLNPSTITVVAQHPSFARFYQPQQASALSVSQPV